MQFYLQTKPCLFSKQKKKIVGTKKRRKGSGAPFRPRRRSQPIPLIGHARSGTLHRRRAPNRWAPPVRHLVVLDESSPDTPVTNAIPSASISQTLAPSASQKPPINTPASPLSPRTNDIDRDAPRLPQSSPHHRRRRHPLATPLQAPATN
jgi:hypothetical protein